MLVLIVQHALLVGLVVVDPGGHVPLLGVVSLSFADGRRQKKSETCPLLNENMGGRMARVSQAGVDLIKRWEGLRLDAYQDSGGVWTIGYGHTGEKVKKGLVISRQVADELFLSDLRRFEVGVQNALTRHATQAQFDAMVSLAFNIGLNAFRRSTLLKRFNEGDHKEVMKEFKRWNKVGEQVVEGLKRRRAHEAEHYGREA